MTGKNDQIFSALKQALGVAFGRISRFVPAHSAFAPFSAWERSANHQP
jgi:hypothetical protein